MKDQCRKAFDEIFESILSELPRSVRELMETTPILVEDEPSQELLDTLDREEVLINGESDLCGLHAGIPISEQSVFDAEVDYDTITLFRGPIIRLTFGENRELGESEILSASLRKQIRITLLHELGHHLGLTEERLAELGYE
ncbi:MAG: metallopeptidase family protein [Proteobacteria bacterium]|nr:MAG: metallopeptidase family protein [Pseudomonadota bacterium]